MKKHFTFISIVFVVASIILAGCSSDAYNGEKYKRISISAPTLGDGESVLDKTVSLSTKVEYAAKETFSDTMPIYKITPREISEDEMLKFADEVGVSGEIDKWDGNRMFINDTDKDLVRLINKNEISYQAGNHKPEELTKSDDELIKEAKEIVSKISLLEGEYECLGVASVQTVIATEGEYIESKRIAFRRLLDGTRIIGDEICDLYFNSFGLHDIEIHLYNYEKIGEIEMVPLSDAKEKIKSPDAFETYELQGPSSLSKKASTLRVDRVKLIYVNQYSNDCTIIQPVYNFIGTAISDKECVTFHSKVIAIPEKYTYTE